MYTLRKGSSVMVGQKSLQYVSLHDKIWSLEEGICRKISQEIRKLRSCTFAKFKRILAAIFLIQYQNDKINDTKSFFKVFRMHNTAINEENYFHAAFPAESIWGK